MVPTCTLPSRLHHTAYTTKDMEKTRAFYEEVIGLPLVATWSESDELFGKVRTYCHCLFGLADGGALAFFQYADQDAYEILKAQRPEQGQHFAMLVDQKTYDEIGKRIQAAGLPFRETDHGYCKSIYSASPDGLKVEFTIDHPEVDQINAMRLKDCHSELKRWLAGDHRPNNHDRHGITT